MSSKKLTFSEFFSTNFVKKSRTALLLYSLSFPNFVATNTFQVGWHLLTVYTGAPFVCDSSLPSLDILYLGLFHHRDLVVWRTQVKPKS